MSGLDAGVVGEWLADADDAPIPLPWRGTTYLAPPPDGDRGKRIAAFIALSQGDGEASDEALAKVLQGEPVAVLALGRETYDALVAAGMKGVPLQRATDLCLVRWGYGSDEVARLYLESLRQELTPTESPSPKSRARSGPKTSRSTGSASKTRSRAGTRTTSSPKA